MITYARNQRKRCLVPGHRVVLRFLSQTPHLAVALMPCQSYPHSSSLSSMLLVLSGDLTCQRPFGGWLTVNGVIGIVMPIVAFAMVFGSHRTSEVHDATKIAETPASSTQRLHPVLALTYTAAVVWLVIGSVWFFNAHVTSVHGCQVMRQFGIG